VGETVVLCIRPENVTISTQPHPEITSARNVFTGRIVKIAPFGPYQKIHLDCGFPLVAYVTRHSIEDLSLAEAMEVRASFKATGVTVIRKQG
jgi:tungstate transport system ATP-binding protein